MDYSKVGFYCHYQIQELYIKTHSPSHAKDIVCSNNCKIFSILKIKHLNIASEGTAVSLNLKSSLFTGCILYLLENDTK